MLNLTKENLSQNGNHEYYSRYSFLTLSIEKCKLLLRNHSKNDLTRCKMNDQK